MGLAPELTCISEYPASIERGGPPEDTPNLTLFFKELRAGLGSSLISLATPAGYWFLKGFELDKISGNLDFINMMSYDYRSSSIPPSFVFKQLIVLRRWPLGHLCCRQ